LWEAAGVGKRGSGGKEEVKCHVLGSCSRVTPETEELAAMLKKVGDVEKGEKAENWLREDWAKRLACINGLQT
jgi:hypothetical protein